MPQRHRNHELETESQRAFESAMPSTLVVRPISDDYGVDREVEVFDNNKTTGLTFKVQLKGTDKSGKTRRIKREHLYYWHSLDVPVLLVSYEASTQVLRARWVHSVGMDGPDSGAATVTVHMDSKLDLPGNWVDGLADDLYLIRAVRRGDVPSPMPVRIKVDEGMFSASRLQVRAALLKAGRRTGHPMTEVTMSDEAAMTLTFTEGRVQCALPLGLASCTLHMEPGLLREAEPSSIAGLGLVLAAATLVTVDETVAREWALAVDPKAPWWDFFDLGSRLISALANPRGAMALLEIHAHLVSIDSPVADLYLLPLMDLIADVPDESFNSHSEALRRNISPDADGGRRSHNLAQLHKARRDYRTAAQLLTDAGKLAPGYLTDPLYLRHLGACEWELGNFDKTTEHYKAAVDRGFDAYELLPLLADALMYAGRYAEAREALKDWTPSGGRGDRLGLLRGVLLDRFAELGLTHQDRGHQDGLTEQVQEGFTPKPRVTNDELLALLRNTDALNPLLWALMINPEEPAASLEDAIIAAVLAVDSAHGWTAALISSLARGDSVITAAILDQARFHCGDDFYDAVIHAAEYHGTEEASVLRDMVSETWLNDPETFEQHLRFVDFSQSDWVIEDHIF